MTQRNLFDPPATDNPFNDADSEPETAPQERQAERKARRPWLPHVPDDEWEGIPDMPCVVGIDQDYDFEVVGFDGNAEEYRQHLAKMILDGTTTHGRLVYIGKLNGGDGVRLGTTLPDHGEVLAKAIDAALRHDERRFMDLVRRHFAGGNNG